MPAKRPTASSLLMLCIVLGCSPGPSPVVSPAGSISPPSAGSLASAAALPSPATPSPAGTAGPSTRELAGGSASLAPGRYTNSGFRPPVSLTLDEGWFPGTIADGFFDVQQDRGTPDVVAVQFGRVLGVIGAGGGVIAPTSAADAARTIHDNPGVVVIDESGSRLGGLEGTNVVVENRGTANAPILDVSLGRLGIDPDRRLWISLFDTSAGVLAVMVGGSVARWDDTLSAAEPLLESVAIDAPRR